MTIIVSLSGGMDSTAALYAAKDVGVEVRAVGIDYGQRHHKELRHAGRVAAAEGVRFDLLDLRGLLSGSALLGQGEVPHGHYAEASMAATVVPGRNLAFIAALVGSARPHDEVWVGVHAGDHFVYPDCRPTFIHPLAQAIGAAYEVRLYAPWLYSTKAEIITHAPGAPYELSWSCYEGGEVHCGRCGTCVERAEAFSLAGVPDPTTYADPDFWRSAKAPA